jgi:hypothetical protein
MQSITVYLRVDYGGTTETLRRHYGRTAYAGAVQWPFLVDTLERFGIVGNVTVRLCRRPCYLWNTPLELGEHGDMR